MHGPLRVVILKPSKYAPDGFVKRFRWGFMPNSTVPYLRSMTPADVDGTATEVHVIDEYVHTDLRYLDLLRPRPAAAARRCWRWSACRATSSIGHSTSRRWPGPTGAWRSSAALT